VKATRPCMETNTRRFQCATEHVTNTARNNED